MAKATLNKINTTPVKTGVDWNKVKFPVSVRYTDHRGSRQILLLHIADASWRSGPDKRVLHWFDSQVTGLPTQADGSNNNQAVLSFEGSTHGGKADLSKLPQIEQPKPEVTGVTLELTVEEAAAIHVATGMGLRVYDAASAGGRSDISTGLWSALNAVMDRKTPQVGQKMSASVAAIKAAA